MSEKIGHKIIRFDELGSTNTYVMQDQELLRQDGLVVITRQQTAGKGRAGRTFISIPDQNVTFSVVLNLGLPLAKIQVFALLAGIAVARVLEKYTNKIRLKWPNDVLVDGKKICGILLETTSIKDLAFPTLVMGIGLNTQGAPESYPEELRAIVTTLAHETNRFQKESGIEFQEDSIANEIVFQNILAELEDCLKPFKAASRNQPAASEFTQAQSHLMKEWLQRAHAIGRKVRSLNNTQKQLIEPGIVGTIQGLSREGYLQILTESGDIFTHVSGDIIDLEGDMS